MSTASSSPRCGSTPRATGARARRRDRLRRLAELRPRTAGPARGGRPARRAPPSGAARGRVERDRGTRRRCAPARLVDRATATPVLRLRRLVRARDRRAGRPARILLRREPGGLGRCRLCGRGTGRALGERVHRLPHSGAFRRGDDLERPAALAATRERAIPGSRRTGMFDVRGALYCSDGRTTPSFAPRSCSGSAPTRCARSRRTASGGYVRTPLRTRSTRTERRASSR